MLRAIFLLLAFLIISPDGFKVHVAAEDNHGNEAVKQRASGIKLFQALFRTRRLARLCAEGEYYETAINQCRSCSIPCRVRWKLCLEMGCAEYFKTTRPPVTIKGEGQGKSTLATETNFTASHKHMFIGIITGCITILVLLVGGLAFILIRRARGETLLKDFKECINGTGHSQTKTLIGDEETGKDKEDDGIKSLARGRESENPQGTPDKSKMLSNGTQPSGDLGDIRGYYGSAHKLLDEPSNTGHYIRED